MSDELKVIARIRTDFPTKFGVPRQSGLIDSLVGTIEFEGEFRNPDAVRGLEGFSHIWLIWRFSETARAEWSATVRPPRLGGNERVGVFATRSPYRPNPVGLSSVRLLEVSPKGPRGPFLRVAGADLVDGTPIYDIKPYIPYTDSHPDAQAGFVDERAFDPLEVIVSDALLSTVPDESREALVGVLARDPRPQYQGDPTRVYGLEFGPCEIKFTVEGRSLTVVSVAPRALDRLGES